ncbi:MAG: ATP-binding protein [Candidatus Enteromonas sp.]|nr:ATP-binding protein [Candidatus Enteromonas sp.]
MYTIKRHIAPVLEKRFKNNICLSINGARQVGKSTLCNHLFPDAKKVNFDNKIIRMAALEDEAGFLNNSGTPLFIDEAQKAPSIFEAIKDKISYDNLGYSSYVLSGSQKLKLHAGEETLAGRVSTNEINGLSLREIFDVPFDERFLPNDEYISSREKELKPYKDVWNVIHRGQYPELYENPDKEWEDFYQSYVNTYIERDVAGLISAKNIMTFFKFMTSIACRTGNVLSYTSIANEVGVDAKTISEWVSILERSGIVYLLKPYYSSHLNRAIKSPKIYFRDTGLACYLSRWLTPETARNGSMSGALFETFVVNEIIKTYSNRGLKYDFSVFYYRGKDRKKTRIETENGVIEESVEGEIDLIIQEGDDLYPIEIKETASPKASMASYFDVLDKEIGKHRKTGVILCTIGEKTFLRDNLVCLPLEYI